ncbi:MAG: hypothetical protein D6732_23225 [Methanobacteriota archaeon]|nr:MAG: hypothetical protein D6732_23225 [Euryarchaeota archaeon]
MVLDKHAVPLTLSLGGHCREELGDFMAKNRCIHLLEKLSDRISHPEIRVNNSRHQKFLENMFVLAGNDIVKVEYLVSTFLNEYLIRPTQVDHFFEHYQKNGRSKSHKIFPWYENGAFLRWVSVDYYLENYRDLYAEAENWDQFVNSPDKIKAIENRIKLIAMASMAVQDLEERYIVCLRDMQAKYPRKQVDTHAQTQKYLDGQSKQKFLEYLRAVTPIESLNIMAEIMGGFTLSCPIEIVKEKGIRYSREKFPYTGWTEDETSISILGRTFIEFDTGDQFMSHLITMIPFRYLKRGIKTEEGDIHYEIQCVIEIN